MNIWTTIGAGMAIIIALGTHHLAQAKALMPKPWWIRGSRLSFSDWNSDSG
jgi:hypothetical protein